MARQSTVDKDLLAPDGGWGWCVVLASFLVHVLSDGVMYTNGIMFRQVREHYGTSRQTMGILSSMTLTVAYGSGGCHQDKDQISFVNYVDFNDDNNGDCIGSKT